jgi:hypothetical protein
VFTAGGFAPGIYFDYLEEAMRVECSGNPEEEVYLLVPMDKNRFRRLVAGSIAEEQAGETVCVMCSR